MSKPTPMTEAEQQEILDRYPFIKAMSPVAAYRSLANTGCFIPQEMGAALAIRAGLGPRDGDADRPAVPWWKRLWILLVP